MIFVLRIDRWTLLGIIINLNGLAKIETREFLLNLCRKYTEPLAIIEEKEMRKAKRKNRM